MERRTALAQKSSRTDRASSYEMFADEGKQEEMDKESKEKKEFL